MRYRKIVMETHAQQNKQHIKKLNIDSDIKMMIKRIKLLVFLRLRIKRMTMRYHFYKDKSSKDNKIIILKE